ncbi:DUF624 domain-containing protein [Enterococcus sp. BWM-S5]|uniref:DUF624 domain-containing protein n=1 Tax=Enterococcus larvae TaxID=2794352 RepID=A0ABS4CPT0_9ENTE|nr:DUF624 domain-containing protein [Enterococcus larvae]MBP1048282.1 DUF624 domain-containing protein [Enterococcus larvae]
MRTFENNIYMKAFSWVYNLLVFNLLFTLMNLPLFLAFSLLAIDFRNLLFFLLAALPFGGAFAALLGSLQQFIQEKEDEPFKVFFSQMRSLWLKGTGYWLIAVSCLLIVAVDLLFFSATSLFRWVSPLFFIIGIIGLSAFLNSVYFQIRNPKMFRKAIYKISLYYTIRKWYAAVINSVLFMIIIGCMLLKPQFGYLLAPSLLGGLIYLNSSKLHKSS